MDFNEKSLTTTRLLCAVCTCLLMSSIEAQYKLSVDVRPQSVKEGDTLTVKCKVNKTSSKAEEVEIVWVRRMVGERDLDASGRLESKELEIGRNATVLEDFQKSGKYKASQDFRDFYQIYSLIISDLKSTDSGEVGCRLLNNHIEIFKPVVVHKMPKKISLISKNLGNDQATSYQDKERVEFTELEKRNFQCYIREVYPEPRVRILLGREDITDRFNKSLRLTRTISDEGIVNIGELSALHYDVIMTSYGLEFTYEFDNNSISCLADFPGGGFSTSSATVHVVLKGYTPKFICNHDYHVPLHHSNFQLHCKVLGHPKVLSARVHWTRHTSGNMSVSAGEKHGSYEAQLGESQKDEARARMLTFSIDHIFPQHFRQYQLEATNAMGTSTFDVNLHQIGKTRFVESESSANLPLHLSLTWCSSVALILLR